MAESRNIDYSTNNVGSSTSVLGAQGRSVPGHSVHLVAYGTSGGVTRRVDVILGVPSFPWAIAAGGEITINQGAVVGSLPPGVWPPTMDDLLPADVVSNATTDRAVFLARGAHVMGDVETPGLVVKEDASVIVDGEVREGTEAISLPLLDPARFDPVTLDMAFDDLDALATPSGLDLSGIARRSGTMTVEGTLNLDGAQLFVEGDLIVRGPIQGSGVLVVTGDIIMESGIVLSSPTDVALIAGGEVSLKGTGPSSSAIRGAFYAREGISAEAITVVGAVIAPDPTATVRLSDARVLGQQMEPASADPAPPTTTAVGGTGGSSGDPFTRAIGGTSTFSRLIGDGDGGSGGGSVGSDPDPVPGTGSGEATDSSFLPLKERIRVHSWFES